MKFKFLLLLIIACVSAVVVIQVSRLLAPSNPHATDLAAAVLRAKNSLPAFRDRLEHPHESDSGFFIRGQFSEPKKAAEFLWLSQVQPTPNGFKGKVSEKPFLLDKVHLGDVVTVPTENVVDWTIVHDDQTREGNFTAGLEPTK